MDPLFIKGNYFFPEVYLSWAKGAVSVLEMDKNDLIAQCGRLRLEMSYPPDTSPSQSKHFQPLADQMLCDLPR